MRLLDAAAGAQAMELGLQIAQLLAGGGGSALHEGSLEPRGSLAHAGGAAFARALIVFRAQAGPGDEVAGGREAAHVAADLGKDDTSAQFVDPGDRGQKLDGRAKGLDVSVNLPIEGVDRRVYGVDLVQMQAQHDAGSHGRAALGRAPRASP